MQQFTREQLHAYLDDALSDPETAQVEQALRTTEAVRDQLRVVREERDRGEHSLGAIWRRERISCLTREDLNGFLHGILEPELNKYIEFHLKTIGCATCQANLDDLREKQAEAAAPQRRRRKIFDSSAGLLSNLAEEGK
jgi:anti-sigma factor RsiW